MDRYEEEAAPFEVKLFIEMKSERPERRRMLEMTVAVLTACFAVACSRPDSAPKVNLLTGRTSRVTPRNPAGVRTFSGRVSPPRNAELAFHVGGVLARVLVRERQKVAKGQLIAQLRRAEFQARLETLQGQLDQARAVLNALRAGEGPDERLQHEAQERVTELILANAQGEFDRYSKLIKMGFVSRSQYELVETNYLVAQEQHKAAVQLLEKGRTTVKQDTEAEEGAIRELRGQVAEAELELEDTRLRAPFDGIVAQTLADEGQSIAVDKAIIRLQSIGPIDIVVNGPVKTSDICSPSVVGAFAEFSGAPGLQYPVHVKDVTQTSESWTEVISLRLAMNPPPGVAILPGMTATVSVRYRAAGERTPTHGSPLCQHDAH